MQCSNKVHYSAVQCSAVQCSVVLLCTLVQCSVDNDNDPWHRICYIYDVLLEPKEDYQSSSESLWGGTQYEGRVVRSAITRCHMAKFVLFPADMYTRVLNSLHCTLYNQLFTFFTVH